MSHLLIKHLHQTTPLHQPHRLAKRNYYLLVMLYIIIRKFSSPPILQPLLANLITPNMKLPYLLPNTLKILPLIDIDPPLIRLIHVRNNTAGFALDYLPPFRIILPCTSVRLEY